MNTEKHLDEQVRQALEKLRARFSDHAWEAFEQRLDQDAEAGEPSTSPSFDEMISGKLNHLEVPLSTGDWSQMEKMIEAEETAELLENESVVDNLVYDKFEKFEVAFQPHHWQMMANRLEEEFFFRYHLLRCKASEAALMLLLLLTFVHFSPILNNNSTGPGNFEQPTLPNKQATFPTENKSNLKPEKLVTPIAEASPTTPAAASGKNARHSSKRPSSKSSRAVVKTSAEAATELNANNDIFERKNSLVGTLPQPEIASVSANSLPATLFESMTEQRFANNDLATPSMSDASHANAPLIASLDPQPVQSTYAWEVPQLPEIFFEKAHQLRFSIFTTTDAAYVITPPNKYSVFDTLVAVNADTTLASGYGGGITIGWKKNKWEFQTGGIYSFKRYIPKAPAFLFETLNYYIREEFNGVQLDMLEVPLNASYHFKNEGKWRFYGNIGASAHIITSTVYEIKSDRTPSFSNFAMLPMPERLPSDDKSIREEKDFPDGFFDGGSIHDNFYLTANIGLGMERFVSPRWCVFFQPNYQHHFLTDGIGVNGEKIYNFSFYLGTKVSLK